MVTMSRDRQLTLPLLLPQKVVELRSGSIHCRGGGKLYVGKHEFH